MMENKIYLSFDELKIMAKAYAAEVYAAIKSGNSRDRGIKSLAREAFIQGYMECMTINRNYLSDEQNKEE